MKYLSKFLSLFLVGAMLYATGCTDYDQDIKDLNNKVDELEQTLQGQIDPLKTDLEAVQAALEQAIEEGNAKIAENKEAIDALKAMDKEHDAAIKDAKDAIAAAVVELEALKGQLAELEDKHDADIEAVRAELKEQIDAVNAKIAEAVARIAKNEEAIEALKAKDAELAKAIEDAEAAIAANAADIKENADAIAANAADIEKNAEAIEGLQTDLLALTDKFNAYTIATDAAIETLEGRVDAAEAAIETLEGDVDELYTLHDNQNLLIENLDGRLEELAQYTQDQLDLLAEADLALKTLIEALDTKVTNLENSFIDYQKIVNEQFEKAYADIAKNTQLINDLTAKHNEEVAALQAQDAAILQTLDRHAAWLVELEENLAALDQRVGTAEGLIAKIQTNIAQMQVTIDALTEDLAELETTVADFQKQMGEQIARLDGAIDAALAEALEAAKDAEDAAKAYTDELQKALESELANIRTTLDQLSAYATTIEQKIDEYKASNDEVIEGLKGDIAELLNRVQSIVFVPEYTDGEATIDYATFGGNGVIEGRSTLEYQVYPAECALAIKAENLTYDVVGVKTRASESLKVVDVKGNADGRLFVTVVANLGQEFYNGQVKDYAASLVLASETANLSTEYVGLYPAKTAAEDITMDIVYDDNIVTGNMDVYNVELEYANIEANPDHIAMAGYYLVFNLNGKQYTKAELAEYGYVVKPVRGDWPIVVHPVVTVSVPKNDETGYGEFWLNIEKVDSSLVGKTYSFTYDYYYDESKTKGTGVEAACSLTIIKEQAKADMGTHNAHWLYSKDAAVDAGQSSMYVREFVVENITEVEGFELPSDKEWADIVGNKEYTPTITIKNAAGAVVNDVTALIYAKDGDVLLSLTNFKWDETYTIEATYSFDYIDATVTFTVATEDRNREPIVINFEPAEKPHMFEANLQLTTEYSDPMDTVYAALTFGNEKYYDITCDDYLAANFVVNYTAVDTIVADGKTINGANDTLLAIDEVNGAKVVYTAYCYTDFDFVPTQVEYTKTITTWYGQEVVLNKVLNFEFPVYDFKHNSKYVDGADYKYFSQVQPEYTWNVLEENGLLKFDVAAVKLPVAFEVVDANGKKLSDAEMAALSLTYDFIITDKEHDGISIDPATKYLSYYGGKPSVNVRGEIVIKNDNNTEYVVPTSFDQGGIYESYKVLKFNPVGIAKIKDDKHPVVDVTNSQDYTIDVLDYIELKDVRTSGRPSYDLIVDGEWVVGNGTNGFAQGAWVTAEYMYNIKVSWDNDLSDVDAEVQPYLSFENGTLKFDNKHQIELTSPFTVPVKLIFTNPWMEQPQEVTVNVTFNPIK